MSHEDYRVWRLTGTAVDGDLPGYAYTVGLWQAFQHPEVALFGVPMERFALLNVVGEMVEEGEHLWPGRELSEVMLGRMQVRAVHPSWSGLFAQAPEVRQLVWPDQDGAFPWEPRFDRGLRQHQPHLWLPADDHAPGLWTKRLRQRQRSLRGS